MRVVVLDGPGPPEALVIRDIPVPEPAPGWVLIRVRAFGLNRSELHMRLGLAEGVTFPRVPGIEAVGVVAECPGGEFTPGQQVAALMGGMGRVFDGGYAEYTCVPVSQVVPSYTAVELLADGYQVGFVADAVGDTSAQEYDIALRRLTQPGAVPYTTRAIMNEWWRGDFKSESAGIALELYGKYFAEIEAVTGRPAMFRAREGTT